VKLIAFRLTGFAQHVDTCVRFVDGVPNLIVGPNESGKSQLLTGLMGTIFGLPDIQPFIPWQGEPVLRGALDLDVDGKHVRITRFFAENRVEVIQDGETIYQGRGLADRHTAEDERYQLLLADWLGFTDMDVFRGAVFIEQDQLADDRLSKHASEIKRIISGSREASYDSAMTDLSKQLDRLRRRPRSRNDREIELLETEIDELSQRVRQAEATELEAIRLEENEVSAEQTLERTHTEQAKLSGLLENYRRRQHLAEELDHRNELLRRAREDVQRIEDAAAHRQKLEEEAARLRVPGNPDLEDVRTLKSEQVHAQGSRGRIEREIAELDDEIRSLQAAPSVTGARRASTEPNASLLVAGSLLALGSLILGLTVNSVALAGLLFAATLILFALRSRPRRPAAPPGSVETQSNLVVRRRAQLAREFEATSLHLRTLEERGTAWLGSANEPNLDALIARLERYNEFQVRLAESGAPGRGNENASAQVQDEALTQVAITRRQIAELEDEFPELRNITPESAAEYRARLIALDNEAKRTSDLLADIQVRRRVLASTAADDAASLNFTIREKRVELERKRRLASALELALQTMEECVHEFQEHALDPVAARAAQLLEQITAGRYHEVEIDQETMLASVRQNASGEVGVDALSRGTRDQVHLAVRVGLINAISGGRTLPIIFDDPCVHFDDERLEATVKILSEIARERQVIVLTKDESYTRWFEPTLRLSGGRDVTPLATAIQ
jgi:DNA repair exonuclease SbcCD ATPase subunit